MVSRLNPRSKALSAIWLEEADRVPVSDYGINMPKGKDVLARQVLVATVDVFRTSELTL
jgi:hypothetical protein